MRSPSPPQHATPRSPDRPTYGPAATKVAKALGYELDRWQRALFDVAYEIDPKGRLVYREVRLSVGRQQGKSAMGLVVAVDRCLAGAGRGWGPRQRGLFSSRTGRAAREVMLDVWEPRISSSALAPALTKTVKSNGDEALLFGDAKVSVMPTSLDAGHGLTTDLLVADECWSFSDDRIEVGARPTQITRSSPVSWFMSAAGESAEASPWWFQKLVDVHDRSAAGDWGSVCGLEYAAPADADPSDPETWLAVMPAVAEGRIPLDVIRAEFDSMPLATFKRTLLNMWGSSESRLISAASWARCEAADAAPAGTLHLGIDVAPGAAEGRSAAIVVAGRSDGVPVVEVIDHRDGTGWVVERVAELDRRHGFATITVDSVGPIRLLLGELRAAVGEKRLKVLGTADVCAAAGRLLEAINDRAVRHRGQESLTIAAAGAAKRPVGDSFALGRRSSTADVSPLIAASLCHLQAVRLGDAPLVIR